MYSIEEVIEIQRGGNKVVASLKYSNSEEILSAYMESEIDYGTYSYLVMVNSRAGVHG